ncbi:DUF4411 family protein [Thermanaerothrix sp. 4228-RoL]|uniref:DUF4411 family protein n=1 Tax=Thermanaerothrix solaris TaxID=3058434 RepID=A0ABU3NN37_9CHLR|nr:DUF4411 family protein [Thermanaerothrix sp. 4228-RoL]MDT8898264.1 DUF4411 family protein [Thermanaerothrix sp. 4228-RoL]
MKYCLDTNAFIEPSKGWYAFDIAPSFWNALIQWSQKKLLCSIQPVFNEIVNHKEEDDLVRWAKQYHDELFLLPDEKTWSELRNIANLVMGVYEDHLAEGFLGCADPIVIAYAKAHQLIVVTEERIRKEELNSNGKVGGKKIKIPNVCERIGVSWVNTVDMLRDLKFQF